MEEAQLDFGKFTNSGYIIKLKVTYKENKLPQEALKTNMTLRISNFEDFLYDRSVDYTKDPLVLKQETYQMCWRVLGIAVSYTHLDVYKRQIKSRLYYSKRIG